MFLIPTISIVDDDPWAREGIKDLVASLGYRTLTFASAEEFLESGCVERTACVISDLQMPGLSGIQLQDRLIADGHHMPIIFITAYPEESVRTRAMTAGAVCFMSKPYSEENLIGCIEKALKSA